ncbi:uncharacterized protein LOC143289712 isoform X2 [Babylonia areolata]|uniref:uncharacterized protein LOC143289712 isoform X2 n=1 Tax=Babylonia areolata TaxID=304850 RepID=UPI003FD30050
MEPSQEEELEPCFIPRRLSICDDTLMVLTTEGIMEDISEVIPRQFLNCGLCNEEFQNPKLLPCLHSFCRHCLAAYIHAHPHPLSCPQCGTQVKVNDPEVLPDNVLARRLSCPSLTSTPRHNMHCATCTQHGRPEVRAVVHCANCDDALCDACAHTHSQQVETSSHKVEPLVTPTANTGGDGGREGCGGQGEALARTDSVEGNSSGVLSKCCERYDTYDIDSMYCVDCELALCADCQETHDKEHRCAELSAIAQNFTAKIQAPVEDLKRDSLTLTRLLSNLDRAERYTGKLQRDMQTKVRRRTRVLCGLIRDYENALLQEIERRHQHNMAAIVEKRVAASQHAASISAVTELTDKLLQFGSEEEKVALRRKVGRRVRELCEADLPSDPLEMTHLRLYEPSVTVETICDLFGELRTDMVQPGVRRRVLTTSQSFDSARTSISESVDDNATELTELEEEEEEEEGGGENSMLSNSDRSETFQAERRKARQNAAASQDGRRRHHSDTTPDPNPLPRTNKAAPPGNRGVFLDAAAMLDSSLLSGEDRTDNSNSSFQSSSSAQDTTPTQILEAPHKELVLPDIIARDNIKGVGVNTGGDIVIATMATVVGGGSKSAIYILEQHGFVRGQIPVSANWNIHCVASDGRVALIIPRGDNRYKVKVMSEDGSGAVLADVHLESLGLNFATATTSGHLLVAANRYAKLSSLGGKAAKSGGNIAIYDQEGRLDRRLTNEDLAPPGTARLMEKPHWLAMDGQNNIFVADSATHCVVGFSWAGKLLFRLGNCDLEDLYQGPDSVCVDRLRNVIVLDKKEKRIDIINYQGHLLKCLFSNDSVRFVCPTPNKLLLVLPTEGTVKLYQYL